MFEAPTNPSVPIWRYTDLAKFIWLLENQTLFFARADLLGDPHEGSLSDVTARLRDAQHTASGGDRPEWRWARGLSGTEDVTRHQIQSTFVNCWNMSEHEKALLWRVYGRDLAIRSTYESLCDAFTATEPVFVGVVHYIDYRRHIIPLGNAYYPLVYKRDSTSKLNKSCEPLPVVKASTSWLMATLSGALTLGLESASVSTLPDWYTRYMSRPRRHRLYSKQSKRFVDGSDSTRSHGSQASTTRHDSEAAKAVRRVTGDNTGTTQPRERPKPGRLRGRRKPHYSKRTEADLGRGSLLCQCEIWARGTDSG